jgi:hypothetical protein
MFMVLAVLRYRYKNTIYVGVHYRDYNVMMCSYMQV